MLSFFQNHKKKTNIVKVVNFLPASIKSKNSMQKYPHIIESFDCIIIWLFLCFLVQLQNYQLQNYRNKQFHYIHKVKQSNVYQHLHTHQDLLHKPHLLFYKISYLLKKLRNFWFIFVIFLNFKVC